MSNTLEIFTLLSIISKKPTTACTISTSFTKINTLGSCLLFGFTLRILTLLDLKSPMIQNLIGNLVGASRRLFTHGSPFIAIICLKIITEPL